MRCWPAPASAPEVDGRLQRPAPSPESDTRLLRSERRIAMQRLGQQIEQPGPHDVAAAPQLGDLRDVERVAIGLNPPAVLTRHRRQRGSSPLPAFLQDLESLRVRCHETVTSMPLWTIFTVLAPLPPQCNKSRCYGAAVLTFLLHALRHPRPVPASNTLSFESVTVPTSPPIIGQYPFSRPHAAAGARVDVPKPARCQGMAAR